MGQGGMCVEAKRRDTSMCEWVTMGWGLFIDTYITYLTLHVVDLSISLLPLSLFLYPPPSSTSQSLSISFLVSSCRSLLGLLAATSFTPWSRVCERESVCVATREIPSPQHKIFPPPPFFSFGGFYNDDFQKTIPQDGKCQPYESFGAYTTAINLYDATPHPENIKKCKQPKKKKRTEQKKKN